MAAEAELEAMEAKAREEAQMAAASRITLPVKAAEELQEQEEEENG
jgi:hypothetical protein